MKISHGRERLSQTLKGTCAGLLENRYHVFQERGQLLSTLDAGVPGRHVLMVPQGPSFSENRGRQV